MREVIGLIGKSLASGVVLREMLHLMSELIGLNRGRIVLTDPHDGKPNSEEGTSRICFAYGLTQAEVARWCRPPNWSGFCRAKPVARLLHCPPRPW